MSDVSTFISEEKLYVWIMQDESDILIATSHSFNNSTGRICMENYADREEERGRKTSAIITNHQNSSSPLFLRLLAELELPDTEERVVRVVTLLLPLLLERKLKPDLPLWKE